MATLFLVRHGRTKANADGILAGWTPGLGLDEVGKGQAEKLGARMAGIPVTGLVTSPLDRCQETAGVVGAADGRPTPEVDERLGEVRYGDWEGQKLAKLAKDPLWKVVQQHPSGVHFPGEGAESLRAMADRAVGAIREWDARIEAEHGPDAIWVAVSHGDVIKAILADALSLHLDQFQRIVVDPCSVSVIRYTPLRSFVVRSNDSGGDLAALVPPARKRRRTRRGTADSDAAIGGGAGSASPADAGAGTSTDTSAGTSTGRGRRGTPRPSTASST
ncbi:probable phosphomutase, MSMEG_4193 family [Actinopolymorpha cephalotaxi]|uniref:Phosphomutase (TIGR03848 family) n=1 Tax=Actinopolymorpha cephalotaxi TaxID=504797 RepID=A0A1I3BMK4_9ACTN|nr:histidine phosphatase family protein [Actinopolymorpha cephalotaxi]NYH82872.1 putative phosphomutase (TIGR03848 family) [Actinopolymorpha cephalotaxi]SFH63507.1 probable phosphomutase, MSMEG_4193 family [Actinopolymorpha cephalotaxi]